MAEKPANIGAYKNMNTAKKDMSPEFLKATEKDKQKTAAKNELSAKESAAAGTGISRVGEGVDGAAETETNASSSFINNVSGRGEPKGKGKGKGFFSKKGPITLILILTIGMGGLTLGGQAMQPFALVSNIIQNFDSASYSTTARLNTTLKAGLKKTSKIKLSDDLKASLKLSGIDAKADGDGNLESLSYKSKNGDDIVVDGNNIDNYLKDTEFSGKIAKTGEMVENDSFFTSTAKNWAAKRIGWDKNRWDEFDSGGKSKAEMEAEFKQTAENPDSVKAGGMEQRYETEEDENGKTEPLEKRYDSDTGETKYYKSDGTEYPADRVREINAEVDSGKLDMESKVGEIADTKTSTDGTTKTSINIESMAEAAKKVGSAASGVACAYSAIASSVAAITIAQQVMDMINIASGYMEAVQKVQAGDGDGSSLHMYNNKTNQNTTGETGFWGSTSISSLFGGKTAGSSAGLANVENVLTQGALSSEGRLAGLSAGAGLGGWQACTYSKLAVNALDFALDIASFFSFGITELIKIGKSMVISGIIATVVPIIMQELIKLAVDIAKADVIENMGLAPAGDYTVGGGNYILKQMGRSVGLSAGNETATNSFARYSESVIAARASYDRDNLSPFDITNKNTFLGSIAYSFTQFAVLNSGNQMQNTLSAVSSVLSSAASSFIPMTSATVYSNIASQIADEKLCPLASSVGATATANHCFDYAISDTRTFNVTYEDAKYYLCYEARPVQLEHCSEGETPTVVEGSEMDNYLKYWTKRDTHLGLPDGSATSHKLETGVSTIDGILGAVPALGSVTDIINASFDASNEGLIFGSAYVAGNDEKWGELKPYIQAFLELDTVYEELALAETTVLATYLDNYYAENPLDTSYEGTLARISGLTKEEVVSTLAYMEYLEYVANYNPINRYSFVKELGTKFIKNIKKTKSSIAILTNDLTYRDIRNRNFAV